MNRQAVSGIHLDNGDITAEVSGYESEFGSCTWLRIVPVGGFEGMNLHATPAQLDVIYEALKAWKEAKEPNVQFNPCVPPCRGASMRT